MASKKVEQMQTSTREKREVWVERADDKRVAGTRQRAADSTEVWMERAQQLSRLSRTSSDMPFGHDDEAGIWSNSCASTRRLSSSPTHTETDTDISAREKRGGRSGSPHTHTHTQMHASAHSLAQTRRRTRTSHSPSVSKRGRSDVRKLAGVGQVHSDACDACEGRRSPSGQRRRSPSASAPLPSLTSHTSHMPPVTSHSRLASESCDFKPLASDSAVSSNSSLKSLHIHSSRMIYLRFTFTGL